MLGCQMALEFQLKNAKMPHFKLILSSLDVVGVDNAVNTQRLH